MPETVPIAPRASAVGDERLAADEHRQPEIEVRLDALEGRLADLEAGQVVDRRGDASDDLDRQRIAGSRGEGVAVERQRRAGAGRGHEVRGQRIGVEREVRRRDDRDRIGADLGGVGRQRDRVGRGLGAGMDHQACRTARRGRRAPPGVARRARGGRPRRSCRRRRPHRRRVPRGRPTYGPMASSSSGGPAVGQRRDGGDDERPVAEIGEGHAATS